MIRLRLRQPACARTGSSSAIVSFALMSATNTGTVLHWFRRGLRLHDNPALVKAVSVARDQGRPLLHVYVLDPHARGGALRARFVYDSIQDLDRQLRERGTKLFVAVGEPRDLIPSLAQRFSATTVVYESETASWARARDEDVCRLLLQARVDTTGVSGLTLYDPQQLAQANGGVVPTSMSGIQSVMGKIGHPELPLPAVESFAPLPEGAEDANPKMADGNGCLPAWETLGISLNGFNYRYHGGETAAIAQMVEFLERESGKIVANFEKPNTSPAEFRVGQQDTTVLSPHLAIGTLSPRLLYHEVRKVQAKFKKVSQPPVSLLGQLMFRELFHALMATVPNFEAMSGNPMCRDVEWDSDDEAMERWRRWENAQTGYPWIDALMTQLRTEGFVHHLGRHSLACFLTRGDLWVSWEKGQETFERYLIDWDEALNAGNWMWLSASAFFTAYFRVYSPTAFAKRWSAAPSFIRHYLPVLAKVPEKYIFEPWTMPASVARAAGVQIGKDYPRPMVDHAVVSKRNVSRMATAYGSLKDESSVGSTSNNAGAKRKRSANTRSGGSKTYRMSK